MVEGELEHGANPSMTVKHLDPGTSATLDLTNYDLTFASNGSVSSSASNGHGQPNSFKATANTGGAGRSAIAGRTNSVPPTILADAGGRLNFYWFPDALPSGFTSASATQSDVFVLFQTAAGGALAAIAVDTAGHIRILDKNFTSQATGSATISTTTPQRIAVCYTITSAVVNEWRVYVNGVLDASASNMTVVTGIGRFWFGPFQWDSTSSASNHYFSDCNLHDGAGLNDPGDIRVTAKRPFANGTSNDFATQIGSGGSGYGSGHAPQVNERALSTTNGWSGQSASKLTEEYSIEGLAVGDVDLTGATIVDYMAWADVKVASASTGNIITGGVTSNISVTTSYATFRKIAGSTTYPAGNTDIGMDTNTVNQLFSLAECGVVVAYNPASAGGGAVPLKMLMGVGA